MSASKPSLLIVDDDPLITDSLSFALARDFAVLTAQGRSEAVARLREAAATPALALVDLGLPPTPHRPDEGYALIRELLARWPDLRIVVLTGQGSEDNARHARALGAVDFVVKPVSAERLRATLAALAAAPDKVSVSAAAEHELVGDSAPIRKLRLQIRQYADAPYPVLIEGESGSGKEIVAAALHQLTPRRHLPYLALNCAAIAPSLVEATLFGHAKGAFTGAQSARPGYFEEAARGALFLDEIGELPLELQAKLLRVLENGKYSRVGETQERTAHARVIAATNRDLKQEVRAGRFRADLYHRLSVFTIAVPPLREMGADRLLLFTHFQQKSGAQLRLSPEAQMRLLNYSFPGNVRELRNVVIRLAARHPGGQHEITLTDLENELDSTSLTTTTAAALEAPPADPAALIEFALARLQAAQDDFRLDDMLMSWERAFIEAAQRLTGGNISQTARRLGVNRTTLYNRLHALGLAASGAEKG